MWRTWNTEFGSRFFILTYPCTKIWGLGRQQVRQPKKMGQSWPCHSLPVRPWPSSLTIMGLAVPLCERRAWTAWCPWTLQYQLSKDQRIWHYVSKGWEHAHRKSGQRDKGWLRLSPQIENISVSPWWSAISLMKTKGPQTEKTEHTGGLGRDGTGQLIGLLSSLAPFWHLHSFPHSQNLSFLVPSSESI